MNNFKRRIGITLITFGFDPRRMAASLRFILGYFADLRSWFRYSSAAVRAEFPLRLLPSLSDKYSVSGVASGHYFHQDLWAARLIYAESPTRHVDVGSRIDGFVAHLLCFRAVEVLDIRSLSSKVSGLTFCQADLMSKTILPIEPAPSVSCLHALEHFGLGRYGDRVEPDGWRTGFSRLVELVAPGGRLYLGVPISKPAVEFNAQRIFHPRYILDEAARHGLTLRILAFVDDSGDFHSCEIPLNDKTLPLLSSFDFGCGLFVFEKAQNPRNSK